MFLNLLKFLVIIFILTTQGSDVPLVIDQTSHRSKTKQKVDVALIYI